MTQEDQLRCLGDKIQEEIDQLRTPDKDPEAQLAQLAQRIENRVNALRRKKTEPSSEAQLEAIFVELEAAERIQAAMKRIVNSPISLKIMSAINQILANEDIPAAAKIAIFAGAIIGEAPRGETPCRETWIESNRRVDALCPKCKGRGVDIKNVECTNCVGRGIIRMHPEWLHKESKDLPQRTPCCVAPWLLPQVHMYVYPTCAECKKSFDEH